MQEASPAHHPVQSPAKRGRGRPPGSPNRPKHPPLSPDEANALRRRLAVEYAEAVVAEAAAADRVRAVKDEMRARFGKTSEHVIGEMILEARADLNRADIATVDTTDGIADQ